MQEAILEELKRVKKEGIDKELFEDIRRSEYGGSVSAFDSVQAISSLMVECAITGDKIFDEIEALRELKLSDLENCLDAFREDNFALSVIKGGEK